MAQPAAIYIGMSGTVLALDRGTGQELWRASLKGSDFVNVALEDGLVLAATRGELWGLEPSTGEVRWHNKLTGLGRGLVTIASAPGSAALRERRRRDEDSAAGAAVIAAS